MRQPIPARPRTAVSDGLLPITDRLVSDFSHALAGKLLIAQKKYGHKDGWARPDWEEECRRHLLKHIEKGDPVDVAAYCAFMWFHGWSTSAAGKTNVYDSEMEREHGADLNRER